MNNKIIVVGSLNMDLVVKASRHPMPGETLLGSDFATYHGGKGANQAVAAAKLSDHGSVIMIGCVGKDSFGQNLIQGVESVGVDSQFIRTDSTSASGIALITLDSNGQNTIVVAPGANSKLTPDDVLSSEVAFKDAGVLLMQLETPIETIIAAVNLAKKHGVQCILNPAPAIALPLSLLQQIDVLIPNQTELALLSNSNDVMKGIETLLTSGVKNIVVTLGSDGAILANSEEVFKIAAHQVKVVDSVAAGDAFAGAFAVALSEGKSIFEAAIWGNAAGAIAVTRHGAQPSLPSKEEIQELIKNQSKE